MARLSLRVVTKESLDMKSAGNSANGDYYHDNRMETADGAILLAGEMTKAHS